MNTYYNVDETMLSIRVYGGNSEERLCAALGCAAVE